MRALKEALVSLEHKLLSPTRITDGPRAPAYGLPYNPPRAAATAAALGSMSSVGLPFSMEQSSASLPPPRQSPKKLTVPLAPSYPTAPRASPYQTVARLDAVERELHRVRGQLHGGPSAPVAQVAAALGALTLEPPPPSRINLQGAFESAARPAARPEGPTQAFFPSQGIYHPPALTVPPAPAPALLPSPVLAPVAAPLPAPAPAALPEADRTLLLSFRDEVERLRRTLEIKQGSASRQQSPAPEARARAESISFEHVHPVTEPSDALPVTSDRDATAERLLEPSRPEDGAASASSAPAETAELRRQVRALQDERASLQAALVDLDRRMHAEGAAHASRAESLAAEVHMLRGQLRDAEGRAAEASQRDTESREQLERAAGELRSRDSELAAARRELEEERAARDAGGRSFSAEIEGLRNERTALEDSLRTSEAHARALASRAAALERDNESLRREKATSVEQQSQLEHIRRLEDELADAQSRLEDVEKLVAARQEALEGKQGALIDINRRLEGDKRDLEAQLGATRSDLENAKRKAQQSDSRAAEMIRAFEELNAVVRDKETQLAATQAQVISAREGESDRAQELASRLEAARSSLEQQQVENRQLEARVQELTALLFEAQKAVQGLKKESKALHSELEASARQQQGRRAEVDSEMEALRSRVIVLEDEGAHLARSMRDVKDAYASAEQELGQAQAIASEAQSHAVTFQQRIASAEAAAEQSRVLAAQAQREVDRWRAEAERTVAAISLQADEVRRLEDECQAFRSECEARDTQLQLMQEAISEAQDMAVARERECMELREQMIAVQASGPAHRQEWERAQAELREALSREAALQSALEEKARIVAELRSLGGGGASSGGGAEAQQVRAMQQEIAVLEKEVATIRGEEGNYRRRILQLEAHVTELEGQISLMRSMDGSGAGGGAIGSRHGSLQGARGGGLLSLSAASAGRDPLGPGGSGAAVIDWMQ